MNISIREFRNRFKKINLKAAIVETVKAKADVIADLQATQMSQGERADGSKFPDYSPKSVQVFGKRPGPWTLKDTGEFYRLIQIIRIDSRGWELTSLDDKTVLIKRRVRKVLGTKDDKVFGLNDASRDELVNPHFRPELKRQISIQTGIKLS